MSKTDTGKVVGIFQLLYTCSVASVFSVWHMVHYSVKQRMKQVIYTQVNYLPQSAAALLKR